MRWDIFISHATEDKDAVVRPLASLLRQKSVKLWLDEGELRLGDSLRERIEEGLRHSRYGLVVLSKSFFSKDWPRRELNGLLALENSTGNKILPVWHDVGYEEVRNYSPILADRLAVKTSRGLEQVAREVLRVLRPSQSEDRADESRIDWVTANAAIGRYLETKRASGTNYITFSGDAETLRTVLKRLGTPSSDTDDNWQDRYYQYLAEASFIRQEYVDAAKAYGELSNRIGNNSYAVATIACLACGLQIDDATERASAIFAGVRGKGIPGTGINLIGILDAAVSLIFGEYFSMDNPLLLVYGNDEGRLRDNLERAADAFYASLISVVSPADDRNRASIARAFGDALLNLAVPIAAQKYLLKASDWGANVANDLKHVEKLVKFGYENARIASLRPGERLPVNANMTLTLSDEKHIKRLSAVFGKHIRFEGERGFDDIG